MSRSKASLSKTPQAKILVDSNVYFRLALNFHPLLSVSFGDKNYTLYVIDDFQDEFDNNPRLQRKFNWVDEGEFVENRRRKIKMEKEARKEIDLAFGFIWEHNIATELGASPADVKAIAYGYVLGIPVVTDDNDMLTLGTEFGVKMIRLIDLLRLMHDCGHVNKSQITSLVQHLEYDNDLPYPKFAEECNDIGM
ncbi:MAG: hypothetical protein R2940_07670 [Syntrophotaleaceae bacterium]